MLQNTLLNFLRPTRVKRPASQAFDESVNPTPALTKKRVAPEDQVRYRKRPLAGNTSTPEALGDWEASEDLVEQEVRCGFLVNL